MRATKGRHTDSTVSLGSSRDHVLDEITVARGINDGDVVFGSLKLPESNVNGDTTLTLCLQLVEDPCIFERTLSELSGFFLELLNGSLVDSTAFVDEMARRGGLARVDVSVQNSQKIFFTPLGDVPNDNTKSN